MYALKAKIGVEVKAYIRCFYDAVLLFKSLKEGRGCLKITKFEQLCRWSPVKTKSSENAILSHLSTSDI